MKKILVVCNHFAPDNTIAAVRITKLAKYLRQYNYDITVIAEKKQDSLEDEILKKDAEGIVVIRIDNSRLIKALVGVYQKVINPIKSKRFNKLDNRMRINKKTGKYEFYTFETAYPVIGSLDYLIELIRQYDLYKGAKKYLEKEEDIDYLFTSFGDFFSLFAGYFFSQKNRKIPWILDIRDAICRYKFTPQYVQWLAKLLEKLAWKNADCITGVSKGICRHIPRKYWKKVHCITNGYDRNDRKGISSSAKKDNKIRFAYTGAMYGGIRNLEPLYIEISKLIVENKIEKEDIQISFAGKESAYEIFKSQAEKYNLGENCVYHGFLTRKDSLKLQGESDILLVSSFDYQTNIGGIITGKALEYMSAGKPIIAIINGDIEHSELAEIIREANLGFAYEESHDGEDSQKLYQYLLEKFIEYKQTGKIKINPNEKILRKYDYQNLGKRLVKIMENL